MIHEETNDVSEPMWTGTQSFVLFFQWIIFLLKSIRAFNIFNGNVVYFMLPLLVHTCDNMKYIIFSKNNSCVLRYVRCYQTIRTLFIIASHYLCPYHNDNLNGIYFKGSLSSLEFNVQELAMNNILDNFQQCDHFMC